MRVCVVGVGGVGNFVVQNLAMAGVQNFVLIDPDRVELSNLSRQVLFRQEDVGRAKVDAASDWLRAFNDQSAVESRQVSIRDDAEVARLGFMGDLIVRTAGYIPSPMGRALNRYALSAGQHYLSVGGASWGPLVSGTSDLVGPCLGCVEEHYAGGRLFGALAESRSMARDTHAPVFGPTLARTAAEAIGEALMDIVGVGTARARGGVCTFTRTGTLRTIEIARNAACADCTQV